MSVLGPATFIGDGDTYENAAIDVRSQGAGVHLEADGSDWTIKNVAVVGGVKGSPGNPDGGLPTISAAVDEGSTGVIENVWLTDPPERRNDARWAGGIHVLPHHAGELIIRRVNIQHQTAFGIDASAPGREDPGAGGGTVTVEQCLLANNGRANLRLGVPDATVDDCVIRTDYAVPDQPHSSRSRGVWSRHNEATIRNSHVTMLADDYAIEASDAGRVTLDGGAVRGSVTGPVTREDVGSTPRTYTPAGCPRSAWDAVTRPRPAAGNGNSSGDSV